MKIIAVDMDEISRAQGLKITLYNIVNRRLRPGARVVSGVKDADAQCEHAEGEDAGNLAWVFGHYTDWDKLWVNWDGEVAARDGSEPRYTPPELKIVVEKEHVRNYCGIVIDRRYPVWKQMNIIREGGKALAEMSNWIDGMRDASNAIEAMDPIPIEFHKLPHWPQRG